ncbi:hypothetical protein FUAX_05050 [Fulvitalea axinellae]|uniref:Uncharacterized protein n=1 Tax=Fulvitalea axinellae TaxID=1182444 RepID=A0AAU9CJB1_9BACT|nr:hypothetical protein FUAX_05050 [Fulvitalea axinellae]
MKISILPFLLLLLCSSAFGQNTKIRFDDFTLDIVGVELSPEEESLEKTFSTDVVVNLEAGDYFELATVNVTDSKLSDLRVEMSFETSLTIMNEGPHCDLTDWKYNTPEFSDQCLSLKITKLWA